VRKLRPRNVPVPSLVAVKSPVSAAAGRAAGVAYLMLTVHGLPGANGVVNEQVVPVMLYKPPMLIKSVSAVIRNGPAPVLVIVTTLVTGARGDGMVKVRVRPSPAPLNVPWVADVKLSVPGRTPVPVRVTGEPVTVAPG
jgi:hypothetical protein